jgi:hypothetical protein
VILLAGAALAAIPDGLRPVVGTADVGERFARWLGEEGMPPEHLICEPFWPEVASLCFRVWDKGKRRWVVGGDLQAWGVDEPALKAAATAGAEAKIRAAELVPIGGTKASYLRLVDGDGWAAAALLRPDIVAERLGGGPIRVAVPADSVVVAWKVQGDDIDRIMAVGVRELYDQTKGPVSPKIETWDGAKWEPFGEAHPTAPPAPPAPQK